MQSYINLSLDSSHPDFKKNNSLKCLTNLVKQKNTYKTPRIKIRIVNSFHIKGLHPSTVRAIEEVIPIVLNRYRIRF